MTPWIGLMWKAKKKTYGTFASKLFSNFRVYWPTLFSFLSWLQTHLNFFNIIKIDPFMELFISGKNIFLLRKYEENMRRFLTSFRHVSHNLSRISLTLSRTIRLLSDSMWVTLRIIKCNHFHHDLHVNMYVNGSDGWYFSTWCEGCIE